MAEVVLALGSNLLDREKNLKTAIEFLSRLPNTTVEGVSSIYATKPFLVPDEQNDYLNCCAKIKTDLSAETLLGCCLGIESAMGRIRTYKNAARIIDIDLLLYEGVTINMDHLVLPHPRIKERAFVMVPLSDLYPTKIAVGFDFTEEFKKVGTSGVLFYSANLQCTF